MNQKMREYYSRLSERYHLWNARKALAASGTIGNHLERPLANGTPEGLLERAKRSGTEPQALLGTPKGLLEQREALHRLHGASVRLSEVEGEAAVCEQRGDDVFGELLALEMPHVHDADAAGVFYKLMVLPVSAQIDVCLLVDSVVNKFRSCAPAHGYAAYDGMLAPCRRDIADSGCAEGCLSKLQKLGEG